jgi:putative membrane protein
MSTFLVPRRRFFKEGEDMTKQDPETKQILAQNRRVHLANERTFLAWIRTAIGIMAFGFVVEKFGLFLKYLAHYLIQAAPAGVPALQHAPWSPGYSSILGMTLLGLGTFMGLLAFVRYKRIDRQIDEDTYHPSLILDILLTISVTSIGLFLLIYLWHTL